MTRCAKRYSHLRTCIPLVPSGLHSIADGAVWQILPTTGVCGFLDNINGYATDAGITGGYYVLGDYDYTLTVYYRKIISPKPEHTLTVNYRYEDGTQAAPPVIRSLTSGSQYSITSPVISGHNVDTLIVLGVMPDKDLTVTVTYVKNYVPPPDSSGSSSPDPPPPIAIDPEYVGFDVDALYVMANGLRSSMGTAFSIAMFCFLIVAGIYVAINFIDYLGR